jgi:hypothetical protein
MYFIYSISGGKTLVDLVSIQRKYRYSNSQKCMSAERINKGEGIMKARSIRALAFILIALFFVFTACHKDSNSGSTETSIVRYKQKLKGDLVSTDWQTRFDAFKSVKSLGWGGRDLMLIALKDKSEIISKGAQSWFVDHGEDSIEFLVPTLQAIDSDIGLYACIAGGKERNIGKSIAGTIWLTLVSGIPRLRCYEVMQDLSKHPSPRIRAVVVFTAGSLRDDKYLEFFDILAA